jgi:hypothetical protein
VIGGDCVCSLKRLVERCPVTELHTRSTAQSTLCRMIVRAGRIDTSAKMAGMPEDRHQGPTDREWRLLVERRCGSFGLGVV